MKILLAFTENETTRELSRLLVDLGWPKPGTAHNSDDAVAWINESGGCDLLISEVYFSPADGFTLRDTVLPFLPEMRTLFSSRFDISPYADRLSGCPFLPHPVNAETLRRTVEELLGRPKAPESPSIPEAASLPAEAAAPSATPAPGAPVQVQEKKKRGPRKKSAPPETVAPPAAESAPQEPALARATPAPSSEDKKNAESPVSAPAPDIAAAPPPPPQGSTPPSAPLPLRPAASPQADVQIPSGSPAPAAVPKVSTPPPPPKAATPPSVAVAASQSPRPAQRVPTTAINFEEPATPKPKAAIEASHPPKPPFASPVTSGASVPKVAAATPKLPSATVRPAVKPTTPPSSPQPAVVSAAGPKPASSASPVRAMKSPAAPVRAQLPPDELVGTTLGNYEIQSLSAKFQTERIYRARQTNIERQVLLTVLDPESAKDTAVLERFLADSRAKARVSHSTIAAVYEGGADKGFHFYSSEFAPVPTLAQIQSQDGTIKPIVALQIFKVVADAFAYFAKENIPHLPLTAEAILLKPGGLPRLANIACGEPASTPIDAQEMQALGGLVHKSLPQSADSKPAREVAARLLRSADEPVTWHEVAVLAESKIPKSAPADAAKIQARDIAVSRAVGETRKKSRVRLIIGSAISLALTAAACFAIYHYLTRSSIMTVDDLGAMIEIPAGEFAYQDERMELPKFQISKYEVTIYEYKKFLDALAADPGLAARVAHPSQPPGKSHVPKGWADETQLEPPNPGYFTRARKWGQYQGAALSLDSPVFGVDWFDAYAYATWKGHKLPTEEQWEKAARGRQGGKYPWGNEEDLSRANTGADYTANPDVKKGEKDGFKRSSPVNQPASDRSSYGVHGMAGNVSEWTATLAEDPEMPGEQIPVIRGGNWRNPDQATVTRRVIKLDELMSDETLGFRTVLESPPAQQ